MERTRINRTLVCAHVALAVALLPGQARANDGETLKVTKNTALTEDFVGNVEIRKDGVTLDCLGRRIIGNGTQSSEAAGVS